MIKELIIAFAIVAACVVIHITGMVTLGMWLVNKREWLQKGPRFLNNASILIAVFAVIIPLHMAEAGIWGLFYSFRGLFPDFETSLYFSLTAYTTIGFGDTLLPQKWRLLGGIEGISGVLLCGVSTAFIFAIVNVLVQNQIRRRVRHKGNIQE